CARSGGNSHFDYW
nr:immunoglobulin heavy chain junction region [Mus musculus]